MAEWVEYHRRMGATKFYVYDHNSTVPVLDFIKQYVASGLVEYTYTSFPSEQTAVPLVDGYVKPPQVIAYDECLQVHGRKHKFIAFTDVDEFIVVVDKKKRIPEILQNYENFGGVSLNWMMFGSSGHIHKPPGGVIANYHKCYKHHHIKHIIRPEHAVRCERNPHIFKFEPGYFSVDTNFTEVVAPSNFGLEQAYSVMYINHYNTRSLSEFITKIHRGRGAMHNPHEYSVQYFLKMDAVCVDECPILQMPPLQ